MLAHCDNCGKPYEVEPSYVGQLGRPSWCCQDCRIRLPGEETEVDRLKRELQKVCIERDESDSVRRRLQTEVDELKEKLTETQTEREQWSDAIRTVALGCIASPFAARAAIAELRHLKESAEADKAKLRTELATLKEKLFQAESARDQFNTDLDNALEERDRLKKEIEQLIYDSLPSAQESRG